ncbi:glycosyl hydrolase family 28-related protein [Parafrankia discariae]|uniref:glycosyl hydrolase family 28-related protein n=1 Tax=Parafrankia discariae TaxID=365528 RepID=UPI00039ED6CE|nr:glycosyl hydrolase family 28-related protein [Parafrankia discariae]
MPISFNPPTISPNDIWGAVLNNILIALRDFGNSIERAVPTWRLTPSGGDDTNAIQTAINAAAAATGGTVHLGKGTFLISAQLTIPATVHVTGDSRSTTTVLQTGPNVAIFRLNDGYNSLRNMSLRYQTAQTSGQENGCAVLLHDAFATILDQLHIINSQTGVSLARTEAATFMASCSVTNIEVNGFSGYGMDLTSAASISTGSIFYNIYIHNNPAGTPLMAFSGLRMTAHSDAFMAVINVEHSQMSGPPVVFSTVENLTVSGLHLEQITPVQNYNAFVAVYGVGSTVAIHGLTIVFCHLLTANIPDLFALIKIDNGVQLEVHGLSQRDFTVQSGFTIPLIFGSADLTTARVWLQNLRTTSTTSDFEPLTADPRIFHNDRFPQIFLGNPGSTPGRLYMESGALKYKSPAGTITTVAPN